jgi:BirA family biotin operon repressor/biotin-[acetyl-CoA-carboxylase] ligase
VLATVDSTNAEAARLAPQLTGPAWILAGVQTAGRGRRARAWSSPAGNFHATLVFRPDATPAQAALHSFAASLALRDALGMLTGLPSAFTLKWPNDVLLNGSKLAGILLESASNGAKLTHLAIGIGVNLIAAPDPSQMDPDALPAVTLLAETGLRIAPETLLDHLAPAFASRAAQLANGFNQIRDDWLANAARLGQSIRARTTQQTSHGIFETINDTGALILRTPEGLLAIPAAEVFF